MQTLFIHSDEPWNIFANCMLIHAFWFWLTLSRNTCKSAFRINKQVWTFFYIHWNEPSSILTYFLRSNTYWLCLYIIQMLKYKLLTNLKGAIYCFYYIIFYIFSTCIFCNYYTINTLSIFWLQFKNFMMGWSNMYKRP